MNEKNRQPNKQPLLNRAQKLAAGAILVASAGVGAGLDEAAHSLTHENTVAAKHEAKADAPFNALLKVISGLDKGQRAEVTKEKVGLTSTSAGQPIVFNVGETRYFAWESNGMSPDFNMSPEMTASTMEYVALKPGAEDIPVVPALLNKGGQLIADDGTFEHTVGFGTKTSQ